METKFKIIVAGASSGGLEAFKIFFAGLPAELNVPVAVVQHRLKDKKNILTGLLQAHSSLALKEAGDKDVLSAGTVYLAPSGYHLLIGREYLSLSTGEPVHYARPSIDVLFETAAGTYGEHVIAVLLTGTGKDGSHGLRAIHEQGGYIIVQEPGTAEEPGMPGNALKVLGGSGKDITVLPLEKIAPHIVQLCMKND